MKPEPTTVPASTGTTVEYKVKFAVGGKGRKRVRAAGEAAPVAEVVPTPPTAPPPRRFVPAPLAPGPVVPRPALKPAPALAPRSCTTAPHAVVLEQPDTPTGAATPRVRKITLLLVLGHHFERLVRDGGVRDYSEIARRTGLTRARVTQIVNLTLLAPEIQEAILDPGTEPHPVAERKVRDLPRITDWRKQKKAWCRLHPIPSAAP